MGKTQTEQSGKPKEIAFGFWAGLLLFALCLLLPLPPGLTEQGRRAGAVSLLMAVWWVSEALPIAVTALLPLALYPVLSILGAEETAKFYADANIFLFLGGFMLALAMQRCGLEKRIAFFLIRILGAGPRRLLAGFMLATAFISMWVSNTATAMMMLPIGLALLGHLEEGGENSPDGLAGFKPALMLGIAYAASIGGVATLVGTPPNMIFAGQAKVLFPEIPPIQFSEWMILGFPLAAGFLGISWIYLAFFVLRVKPQKDGRVLTLSPGHLPDLGPMSRAEWRVAVLFLLTVAGWITRGDLDLGNFVFHGWAGRFGLSGIHDGTVAMAAAVLLFALPSGPGNEKLLDWNAAKELPWGVLLLFGGGFALAGSLEKSGFAAWMAGGFEIFKGFPFFGFLLILNLGTVFASELMSNAAQVTMMMPVLAGAAKMLAIHPYWLMVPATMATSLAFMMPSGTAPNAIIFGSGYVSMRQMARTGFVLNILAAFWVTAVIYLAGIPVSGAARP